MTTAHVDEIHFWNCYLGMNSRPYWWDKRVAVVAAVSNLYQIRQGIYYQHNQPTEFNKELVKVSQTYGIKIKLIHELLGICAFAPHNPWQALLNFINKANPGINEPK